MACVSTQARIALNPSPMKVRTSSSVSLIPILLHIVKEYITECNLPDPSVFKMGEGLAHARLVDLVGAIFWNQNFVQRDCQRLGLLLQQNPPYAVHADAIEVFSNRRQERRNLIFLRRKQMVRSHRAVFASAPG